MTALSGGLVADRSAATEALRAAFAAAEHAQRAERLAVAIDSDDMRTYHHVTSFEREDSRARKPQLPIRKASSRGFSRSLRTFRAG